MKLRGFTLLELSIVLMIMAVLMGGGLTLLVTKIQQDQYNYTVASMDTIGKSILDYSAAFGRIPCPSDLTASQGSTNYGVEAANSGSCAGGSPAANFVAASGTAEGGIPTRTLQLPDSYMYDGWGKRFRYAVDPNYTRDSSTCNGVQSITIQDASGASRSIKAIYAIVSHGANGHGGYTRAGVTVNAQSTNADELTNCHCDSTGAPKSPYIPTYVEKAPSTATPGNLLTTFDDIVTFKEGWQLYKPNSLKALQCPSSYYRTITIDHTKVPNSDQSNFPMLFAGTYAYLATTANGGSVQNANGYDIVFTSDAAGTSKLKFEREIYNATNGQVAFWVNVPIVSHTADTVIYLQYGDSSITTDQSNKTGAWNSNYAAVWHLDETSGIQFDSTTNANNLTAVATLAEGTTTTAKIGGADRLGSTSNIVNTANSNSTLLPANITLEAWINMVSFESGGDTLIYKSHSASPWLSYQLYLNSSHKPCFTWTNYNGLQQPSICGTTALSAGTWYHLAGIYDSSSTNLYIYMNGSNVSSGSAIGTGGMYSSDSPLQFGTSNGSAYPHGYFDEIRLSNTVRSANWLATEYSNQTAPDKASFGSSGYYTVGAVQSH